MSTLQTATSGARAADQDMLPPRQAAAYLGVTRVAIYAALRVGRLRADEVRPRGTQRQAYRFRLTTLEAYRARAGYMQVPHLRAWRECEGLSRLTLAHETGVSESMLLQIETRGQRASVGFVQRIADALGIPAPVLVGYTPTDEEAREYALQALVARAEKRLEQLEGVAS